MAFNKVKYILKTFADSLREPFEVDDSSHSYVIGAFELVPPEGLDGEPEKWTLYGSKVIHGVRTMPNGDPGFPNDVDVFEIGSFEKMEDALLKLGEVWLKDRMENIMVDAWAAEVEAEENSKNP